MIVLVPTSHTNLRAQVFIYLLKPRNKKLTGFLGGRKPKAPNKVCYVAIEKKDVE